MPAQFELQRGWDFQTPDVNKLIAPIEKGYADYRTAVQQNVENERQNKLMGFKQQEVDQGAKRFAREEEDAKVSRIGREATAIHQMQGPQRQLMWQQWAQRNPDVSAHMAKFGIDANDHVRGPEFVAIEAGRYNPTEERAKLAQIAQAQAQTSTSLDANRRAEAQSPHQIDLLKAQAAQANKKDEISEITAGIMRDSLGIPARPTMAPSAPAQPGSPRMQPMSAPQQGGADPLFIQAQTAGQEGRPAQSNEPTVSVFGKPMPASKAAAMAHAMLMNPQTKALGEQIQSELGKMNLQAPLINDLQSKVAHGVENLARLNEIKRMYNPDFQTIETQIAIGANSLMDRSKTLRSNLSEGQRQRIGDFNAYRVNAYNHINQYVKDITGAQMSEAEAQRLIKALPSVESDGPTSFTAKLNESIRLGKLAVVRHNWLLRNNLNDVAASIRLPAGQDTITKTRYSLDNFQRQMDQHRSQILREIKNQNPGADEAAVDRAAKQRMRQEYGI